MKKTIILIVGILIIVGTYILGDNLKGAGPCTCGGTTFRYQPQLFIKQITSYLHPVAPACGNFGCVLGVFPLYIDLYAIGIVVIIASFLKKKKRS